MQAEDGTNKRLSADKSPSPLGCSLGSGFPCTVQVRDALRGPAPKETEPPTPCRLSARAPSNSLPHFGLIWCNELPENIGAPLWVCATAEKRAEEEEVREHCSVSGSCFKSRRNPCYRAGTSTALAGAIATAPATRVCTGHPCLAPGRVVLGPTRRVPQPLQVDHMCLLPLLLCLASSLATCP